MNASQAIRILQRQEELARRLARPFRFREVPLLSLHVAQGEQRLRFTTSVSDGPVPLERGFSLFISQRILVISSVELAQIDVGPDGTAVACQRGSVGGDGFLIPVLPLQEISQLDLRRHVVALKRC